MNRLPGLQPSNGCQDATGARPCYELRVCLWGPDDTEGAPGARFGAYA
jgi:hypothetical protein